MNLYDFLPEYPIFSYEISKIVGDDPEQASYNIFRKKEFYDLRLTGKEEFVSGELLNHQKILARFMSPLVMSTGILMFHQMGTGKTCGSISIIEQIKNTVNTPFKKALILAKGKNIIHNFVNELVYKCTPGIYRQGMDDLDTDLEKIRRMNRNIGSFYEFETFERMSKNNINPFTDDEIRERYSNYVIVIDEVHNIRLRGEEGTYSSFHRFLHVVKNCKIVLMSGTPMRDKSNEIATIMNLILPIDTQLPVGEDFDSTFLDNNILTPSKALLLKKYFHGRVSYVQTLEGDVNVKFMSSFENPKNIQVFTVYSLIMSEFQMKSYFKAFEADKESSERSGVYNDSRQASSFVFPDGSYGSEGFKNYMNISKTLVSKITKLKRKTPYNLKKNFLENWKGIETIDGKLKKLRQYSAKFADCIERILNSKGNHFVYMEYVEGSGAILFAKILDHLFGFSEARGTETSPGLRYSIITNKTVTPTDIKNILNLQGSSRNMNGEFIKVIIGSSIIGEGFSLKNIKYIHIITPDWNFAGTEQAIFRGLRLFSHKDLQEAGEAVEVQVFLYCLLTPKKNLKTIDEIMLDVSASKDISIKSVERALKESSFDCPLNRGRNINSSKYDNTRQCDYEKCDYACDFIDASQYKDVNIDYSTYNLFYSQTKLSHVIEIIAGILSEHTKVKLYSLYDIFPTDKFIVLKAIYVMETTPYIMTDVFGYNCFVRHDNDYIYLTYNIGVSNFFDNYYVDNFPLQEYGSFQREASVIEENNACKIIDTIRSAPSQTQKLDIFNRFSYEIQELLLEIALNVLEEKPEVVADDSFLKLIIDNFKLYVIDLKNLSASTLLYKIKNIFRCKREKGQWRDCDEKETEEILEILKRKREELEKVKYYGIKESSTGLFYIRDVSEEEKKAGKKHKISTGKECEKGWTKDSLLKIIDLTGIPFTGKILNGDLNKDGLLQIILDDSNKSDFSDIRKAFTLEELQTRTREQLLNIIEFGRLQTKKSVLCKAIYDWFEKNNLVEHILKKGDKK